MKKATKPQKAPGAMLNTWILEIDNGSIQTGNLIIPNRTVVAWFTSEAFETISLADEKSNIRIQVPYSKLEKLIEAAREARKNKRA